MSQAATWRWCAAAGVAAFLCSVALGLIPDLIACGPTGGLGPILAFEFARSPADVAALFGGEPCRSTFVGAQKIGLLIDGLGFVPAYVAFLSCAGLALGSRILPIVFVLAGLADEIEGGLLYAILSDLPGTQTTIDALWWAVHLKFALLAGGALGISVLLLARWRWLPGVVSLIVGLGAMTAFAGLLDGPSPVMMIGFTISWATILLAAFVGVARPSLFSARAAPPQAPGSPSA